MAQARLNARDWRHSSARWPDDVDRVVLCSELDARRVGSDERRHRPQYLPATRPAPSDMPSVSHPAVVLFQATFDYAPNVDAAEWLIAEVAPRLRARLPDVEIRLVGTPLPGVQRHHAPPTMTVVGVVPAMEPELARADIAVVPIRYGSGTTLKSSSHLLTAYPWSPPRLEQKDSRSSMEFTCCWRMTLMLSLPHAERLLTEPDLRKQLVDRAENLYLERYERTGCT